MRQSNDSGGTSGGYRSAASRRVGPGGRGTPPRKKRDKSKTWLGEQKQRDARDWALGKKSKYGWKINNEGKRDWDYQTNQHGAATKRNPKMKLKAKTKKPSKMPNKGPSIGGTNTDLNDWWRTYYYLRNKHQV